MKLKSILAGIILSISFVVLGDDLFEYHTMTISKGEVTPGVWNSDFAKAKEYAEQTGSPLIVFWGNASCGHCNTTEKYISGDKELDKWLKDNEIVIAIGMGVGGEGNETNFKNSPAAKTFARQSHSSYPYIRYYWKDENGVEHNASSQNTVSSATILSTAMATFKGWTPRSACGSFVAPDEECNRLEFEDATPSVEVVLERSGSNAEKNTNAVFKAYGPDGKTVFFTSNIVWNASDTNKVITVPVQESGCKASGDKITLVVADASDKDMAKSHITYVTGSGDSAANPLWIGERSVPAPKGMLMATPVKPLSFGEWTMDLDVATQLVAQTEGAYTLVSIQGSLWCPDCANTDRNFLDVKDAPADEFTKFQKWAKGKNIALVTIDIPNFGKTYTVKEGSKTVEKRDVDGELTPCLLKRDAIATTLARNTYTNKAGKAATYNEKDYKNKRIFDQETPLLTGSDPSDTTAKNRSGLGYLTRKGVSDEEAKKVLDRNHFLAASNTALGGFHRPEDGNAYRTGVPIFVLLRRDGTVAGRFTTFAAKSPFTADRANFDDYVRRIEELILEDEQEKNGEIDNNDARTTGLTLMAAGQTTPAGGSSAYCISHADAVDVFKLVGTAPGVRQGIRLSAPLAEVNDKGVVTLELQKLDNDGKPAVVTQASGRKTVNVSVTGLLKDGLNLDYTFMDDDTYYVAVKADTTSAGFAAASKSDTFTAYTLDIGMLIVPEEKLNRLSVDGKKVGQVRVSVERNQWYRLEGLKISSEGTDVKPGAGGTNPEELEGPYFFNGEHYYRAKISGIVKVSLDEATTEVVYQCYNPGEVGFVKTAQTVKENVGTAKIAIERKKGSSSRVRVHVTLDEAASTNIRYADTGEARFVESDAMTNAVYVWEDGTLGVTNHLFVIKDDARYDGDFGPCKFVFRLTMGPEDGRAEIVNDTFELTVTENDRKSAGKVAFTGVEGGYFAKSATVYTKAKNPVTLDIKRDGGSEAVVTGQVQAVVGKTSYAVDPTEFDWGYHRDEMKQVTVSGYADATGKTVKVSFKNLKGGLSSGSPSSVSIVVIPDDAPEFKSASYTNEVNRYVDVADALTYPVVSAPAGCTLSFTKLSGTLPSGLKVSANADNTAMLVTGIPSKADTYTAYYQVTASVKNGKKTVKIPGLVTAITIIVKDPAVKSEGEEVPVNASCVKSRSLTDMMVISESDRRLGGLMNLTIPANTGKVSAKYVCSSGTVSFSSAKSWSELRDGSNFVARLVPSSKKYAGYAIEVEARPDYSIKAKVIDPAFKEPLVSAHYGLTWKDLAKVYPEDFGTGAKDWEGSYTVALPWEQTVYEQTNGYASTGTATLTLKLSDKTNGKMSWGLTLPNGTTASGSSTLAPTEFLYPIPTRESQEIAFLPVYKTTATDRFAAILAVLRGAKKDAEDNVWRAGVLGATNWVDTCWTHMAPAKAELSNVGFETIHGVWGGAYLGTAEDLGGCCSEYYSTNSLAFYVDYESVTGILYKAFYTQEGVNPIAFVKVAASKMSVDTTKDNPQKLKISLASSTGVVKGSFNLQYEKEPGVFKDLSVSYSGVVLPGWGGEWCGCIDDIVTPITLPFVNGSWYFTDKVPYEKPSGKKMVGATLSDQRGAAFWIDPLPQPVTKEEY